MEERFEIRVALPTPKQREIIGRITYDLRQYLTQNPKCRRDDVAIVMTTGLLQQLAPAGFNLDAEARLWGHRVRTMDGSGLEWYITAIHGYVLDSGYMPPDPEKVLPPKEEEQEETDADRPD